MHNYGVTWVCSCFFFWWVHNHGTISPITRDMGPLYIYQWFSHEWNRTRFPIKKGTHGGTTIRVFHLCSHCVPRFPMIKLGDWWFFLGEVHAKVFLSALDVGNSKIPLASYALGSYREGRCCIDHWAAPCKSHRLCASKQQILKSDIRTFNSDVGAPQNCHKQILDSLPRIGFRI